MRLSALALALALTGCASRVPSPHPGPWLKTAWICDRVTCRVAFVGQPLGPGTTKYYRNECVCEVSKGTRVARPTYRVP